MADRLPEAEKLCADGWRGNLICMGAAGATAIKNADRR